MTDFIRQAQAGDIEAFVALMEQQKQGFYRVAKSYLRNDEDVADAMQDTVLACFEKLGQLREPKHFKTWATRILINICNDQLREGQRCTTVEQLPETAWIDPEESSGEFTALLDSLDEKYRTVLLLYYGEGFNVREIAGLLTVNVETVKTRLKRGRAGFKAVYVASEGGEVHDRA